MLVNQGQEFALTDLVEQVDILRVEANRQLDNRRRSELGQFMTPAPIARLMASMLACASPDVHLLDAGAGVGSLLSAVVSMLCARERPPRTIRITAYELDPVMVDTYFRQFNRHTQVNATDLRMMRYPTRAQLFALGKRIGAVLPPQDELDQLVAQECVIMSDSPSVDPIRIKKRIDEALEVLHSLDLPRAQQNERSALTLLALLDLTPEAPWSAASNPLRGITPMMEFFARHYGKSYKPNTRETVRRQTVHQFIDAGMIIANPDEPERAINSPKAVYQIDQAALELLRSYGSTQWEQHLQAYVASVETLRRRYAQEREMQRIPVTLPSGESLHIKDAVSL